MKKAVILASALLCCLSFHSFCQQVLDHKSDGRKAAQANAVFSLLRNDDSTKANYQANRHFLLRSPAGFADIAGKRIYFYGEGYFDKVIGYQPPLPLHSYKFTRPELSYHPAFKESY